MKMLKKCEIALLLLQTMLLFSCLTPPPVSDVTQPPQHPQVGGKESGVEKGIPPAEIAAPPEPPGTQVETPKPQDDYLTIIAVGDNLYHDVMIRRGEEGDYDSAYTDISPLAKKADIAFINQETMLGGKAFGFSGYPQFNSPQALGKAVAGAGFTVVNHANNHVMDKGERAVIATLDFWDTMPGVTVLGIHRSEEQREIPVLLQKNNITVGFLSYTFSTNGIPVPAGKPYLVSLVNTGVMAKEIDALRPLCEFLVVSMHWGEEYQHDYNKRQKELAEFLARHDVDLVIGHHPHVIQKVEYVPKPGGGPNGGETLCFYSLGNFISAQDESPRLLGAMAYIKLKKNNADGGGVAIEEYGALPLVTHYEKGYTGFKVYPLYLYTNDLARRHGKGGLSLAYFQKLSSGIFKEKELSRSPFEYRDRGPGTGD